MLLGEDEDNTRSLQRETSEISSLLKEFPRNTNILVVDHNFTDLLDMKKTMRQYAYQVTVEADAEKAFAFLTSCQHEINIVIWDFHMPGINGIQALKDIGSKMDIPVVIMSDDNQTESVMEATIHGACDYVMKPVREEIIANIWQHIVRKRMMSEKMKMMSQPDSSPPVQSDLAQSDGLDKDKADSKILDQEPNIDRKEENEAMTTPTTWTDESQLVLVQTNNVDQQSDGSITKYQGIGKEENAAKIPLLTWSEGTQLVQSADQLVQSADQLVQSADQLVQTDGLDQYNGGFQFIDQDDDEPSIEKRYGSKQRRQRMMWSRELHQKFLDAIELAGGIRRSSPKKIHQILKGMNIEGLTRYNVASHLQKHRLTITESEIRQKRTAYRTTRLSRGSNNVTLRNDSNNVTLGNGSNNVQTAISSSYLMTGQAVNPIQQTQYQNGSLTMNNNQFITNQLPPLPYVDPRLYQHKHQQQQQLYQQQPYQQQQQPYQPQQQPYQQQQQQYQPQQQPYQPQQQPYQQQQQPYQPQQQPYQPQQQQYQPQQQQYQSSHQFNYVVSNEQPEQASGIGVTGLELTYPSVPPYDPFEHLMKGYSFNQ